MGLVGPKLFSKRFVEPRLNHDSTTRFVGLENGGWFPIWKNV